MTEVSIVIPSYNRRAALTELVSVLFQEHAAVRRLELVVVIDGSTDGSAEALARLTAPAGVSLRIHSQDNRGRAAARNQGLALATGDIVLFLDDDVLPDRGLLAAHLRAHQRADVVLGRINHVRTPSMPWIISETEERFHRDRHASLVAEGAVLRATDVFAGNLSVKRSLFHVIGGFDEAFTGYGCEDWDLGQRLIDAGASLAYADDAVVDHRSDVTAKRWLRHAWHEGRSQLLFARKHPSLASRLDIGGLAEATWSGRLTARAAIAFPRLGRATGAAALTIASKAPSAISPSLRRRVALQSWRLAFWSGVRSAVGSAAATRAEFRFDARMLCYHRVCDDPNPALASWAVRPAAFREQMRILRRQGFRALTVTALIDAFESGRALDKSIVITFDDGYLDTVTTAAPILAEVGFPATIFVTPGFVGQVARWDADYGGAMAPLADWDDLCELVGRGWEIGFHTATHPDLTRLCEKAIWLELTTGRDELERRLGVKVTSFAYPYGELTRRIADLVAAAGFQVACTLGDRAATPGAPRFALQRALILRGMSQWTFRLVVWSGYDPRGLIGFGLGMLPRAIRSRRRPVAQSECGQR